MNLEKRIENLERAAQEGDDGLVWSEWATGADGFSYLFDDAGNIIEKKPTSEIIGGIRLRWPEESWEDSGDECEE